MTPDELAQLQLNKFRRIFNLTKTPDFKMFYESSSLKAHILELVENGRYEDLLDIFNTSIDNMTVRHLRIYAQKLGIRQYNSKSRDRLIGEIYARTNTRIASEDAILSHAAREDQATEVGHID